MKVEKQFLASFVEDMNRNRVVSPSLPEVAVQVRKLVNDPNANTRQIARLIGTDAALTARLMKMVNSPLYRGQEKIENIQNAVTRLGSAQVRNLVLQRVDAELFALSHDFVGDLAETVALIWPAKHGANHMPRLSEVVDDMAMATRDNSGALRATWLDALDAT